MQNLTKAIEGTDSNLRGESFYYRGWGHFLARNIPQAQADMTEAAKVDPKKKEDFYYRITFDAFPDKKFKNTKSVRNAIGELYDKKGWQERELNFQKFKIYTAAVSSLPEEENWMFERVEATVNIPDNPGNVHLDISSLKKYQALAGARNRVHTELQRVLNKRIAALGINMERPFDTPSRNTYFALYNRTNAHGFDPRNIAANITRAEQKIKDRDYHSAIALLNKVLQVEPNNIPALEQRMRAFLFKRAFIRADAEAERILRAQPKNALAMNVRGLFNFEAQNMNAALDYFNRAVAAAPSDPRPLFNRARVYTVKSDYPAALKDFERLRQLAPDVSDYVAGRGNVYYAMKEWEEAALNYMEAVVLDERNFTARINLVRALDQAGQSELADKQHDWLIKNAGDLPALKALEKRNAELVKKSSTEVEEAKSMQKMGGLLAEIDNDSKVIISILKAKPAETKSEAINRLTDARRRIYNIISGSSQIEYMAREMLKTGGSRSPALRQKLEKLLYAAQQFKAVAEEHKVKCEAALKSLQGYL
jgi:tetratricopeptide (TPR) repeat protein